MINEFKEAFFDQWENTINSNNNYYNVFYREYGYGYGYEFFNYCELYYTQAPEHQTYPYAVCSINPKQIKLTGGAIPVYDLTINVFTKEEKECWDLIENIKLAYLEKDMEFGNYYGSFYATGNTTGTVIISDLGNYQGTIKLSCEIA